MDIKKLSPLEAAASNGPTLIVEFRGASLDVMKWTDKNSGKAREMQKLAISAELPGDQIKQVQLEIFPPMGETTVPALTYAKGDLLIVTLSHYEESREKGNRGRIASHSLFRAKP